MNRKNEITALTGLRFVAAFYIFLFHVQIRWPLAHHKFWTAVLGQGAIGMTLFFMLSGFVLAYNYGDGSTKLRDYFVNRFARIYPVYGLCMVAFLPWLGIDLSGGMQAIEQSSLLILTNIFMVQAWLPQLFPYWNDGGSWSISVEAFLYLLFPFLMIGLNRLSDSQMKWVTLACVAFGALPGLTSALFVPDGSRTFYVTPIYRLPDFILGICMCRAYKVGLFKKYGALSQLVAVALLFVYLRLIGHHLMYSSLGHNWIVLPVTAFLVVTLANGNGLIAKLLEARFFVWFGKASYSFYSMQGLILLPMMTYHDALVARLPIIGHAAVLTVMMFLVALAFAALCYHFVEEPCRRWLRIRYQNYQAKISTPSIAEIEAMTAPQQTL